MDSFQHSYYALSRRSLLLIGQWPYQNPTDRLCRMYFIITMLLTFIAPQVFQLITNASFATILEIVPPVSVMVTTMTKMLTLYVYRNNMRNLLDRILDNWKLWKSKEQMDIMHKFSKEGKILTFVYAIYIYATMTMFLLLPFLPRIMDVIVPLNESRRLTPIFKSEYFIDEDEYFLSIYVHMSITIVIAITVLITADILFIILNSHICGIFTAVGFHIEFFLNGHVQSQKTSLKNIICAIKNHKKALEFADLIESSYSIPLFVQVSSSLLCMTVSLFQILVTLEKPFEAARYGAFAGGQLVHLFCLCYPGQRMMDYSTQIQFKAITEGVRLLRPKKTNAHRTFTAKSKFRRVGEQSNAIVSSKLN